MEVLSEVLQSAVRLQRLVPDAVLPPEINEDPRKGELPHPYAARLAREKALAVVADADDVVICADTTVALGRRILGKPASAGEAAAFLTLLGGRRHCCRL